ncbi:putative f-box protein [Quercus suber]|uniref:F-box protein n=1 Tax=Quercus suber TaxID=58331 RepID=A0AAW0LQE7_QUESU
MASVLLLPSSSSSCCCSRKINAAIHVPKLPKFSLSVPKIPMRNLGEELNIRDGFINTIPVEKINDRSHNSSTNIVTTQLYAILEAVADRVEMHANIEEQRDNWNTLLLNSINMMILTAATMAGVAATAGGIGMPLLALKLSSTLLYSAATGMLLIMNKIQPSQLAEEQRNATRLFKQLQSQIQTMLAIGTPTQEDVKEVMEKVLALDKAHPLPCLVQCLKNSLQSLSQLFGGLKIKYYKRKTSYMKEKNVTMDGVRNLKWKCERLLRWWREKTLRNMSITHRHCSLGLSFCWKWIMGTNSSSGCWALASTVNAFEHGGQVGMVIEMYRNCGGFFQLLQESIETTLEERDLEKRENGELFEMKVALKLGRSLSQLRELARKSASSHVDEFASKLF